MHPLQDREALQARMDLLLLVWLRKRRQSVRGQVLVARDSPKLRFGRQEGRRAPAEFLIARLPVIHPLTPLTALQCQDSQQ
jgi:hypothetical protein